MIESQTANGLLLSIPRKLGNYIAKKVIGNGSTCVVLEATDSASGRDFAVKVMPVIDIQERGILPAIRQEIALLRRLSHEHIVRFHDSFEKDGLLFLVTENCTGGDLLPWVLSRRTTAVPTLKRLMFEIGSGIQYMHGQGLAHNDLKPENIALDGNGSVKLVDFGYAKQSLFAGDDQKRGTLLYAPPELLCDGRYDTQKADIWSLAIVFYVMATSTSPYTAEDDGRLYDQIEQGTLTFKEGMDKDVERMVRAMTKIDPNERPTIDAILLDPFFDEVRVTPTKPASPCETEMEKETEIAAM
jgi:serine/threonine protein kinase